MKKNYLSALLFVWTSSMAIAQHEKRVKSEEVPSRVLDYVHSHYPDIGKTRYFKEENKDSLLYIVHVKTKHEKFVLEFFENGELFEIEREEKFENLPKETQQNITKELTSRYTRFKLLKVEFVNPHMKTEYEVTLKAKAGHTTQFLEIFFDKSGHILQVVELKLKPIPTLF